jgi:hypothetical protein
MTAEGTVGAPTCFFLKKAGRKKEEEKKSDVKWSEKCL